MVAHGMANTACPCAQPAAKATADAALAKANIDHAVALPLQPTNTIAKLSPINKCRWP